MRGQADGGSTGEGFVNCLGKGEFPSSHSISLLQVIAAKLWDGLGGMDPVFHLRCVSLLYQLHNLVPNPKAIERILARSLERENDGCTGSNVVDSYQRFSTLWHLSRDLDVKTGGGGRRNFDICLLKMLDNLNLSTGPLRALSQSWLVHAMARGDVARIMEPLLITLLDPTTARVSILFCHVRQVHFLSFPIHNIRRVRSEGQNTQKFILLN